MSIVRGHMCIYLYLTSEQALAYGSSGLVWYMVFNVTFNNISFLLVEVTVVPRRKTDQSQVTDERYQIMLYRVHYAMSGIGTQDLIGDRN